MRGWSVGAAVAVGIALSGVPAATAGEDTANPREGPPGTEVVVHLAQDECPGQVVAFLAETKNRPRLEAGHAQFQAPDDVFVIPAVPVWEGGYQILFACPDGRGLGGFRFFVTEPAPAVTGAPAFTG